MGRRATRVSLVGNPDHNEAWFSVELRGGWTAVYRLIPRDGRPIVTELRVLPSADWQETDPERVLVGAPVHTRANGEPLGGHEIPGDGLTAAVLKNEVVMGRHIYELLPAWLRKNRLSHFSTLFAALLGSLGFDLERKPRRGRRGPKGWPDEDYARLASDYVTACKSGSRSPVADVAKYHGLKVTALRAALNRARKRGLLTRQTGGRAGGQLTARANAVLKGSKG